LLGHVEKYAPLSYSCGAHPSLRCRSGRRRFCASGICADALIAVEQRANTTNAIDARKSLTSGPLAHLTECKFNRKGVLQPALE
jgi:hypothetical protein